MCRFAAQGFELKNDDEQHQALVEIPIPWMGAMKKGPFPLHASLKEAQARKVLIKNACIAAALETAVALAIRQICVLRGRRGQLARVAPLGRPPRVRPLFRHDHVGVAARAARDDTDLLLFSRRSGQVPTRVEVPATR